MPGSRSERTAAIGDAAITVLAEEGMRGLTHRAVDRAARLPMGSTSYYARTRAALLELVLQRMVERDEADAPVAGAFGRAEMDVRVDPPASGEAYAMSEADAMSAPGPAFPTDAEAAADAIARWLYALVTAGRARMLARYECALEVTRRPELRPIYDRAGAHLRAPAGTLLGGLGSADPERHARQMVVFCEGLLFDTVAGYQRDKEPDLETLRADVAQLLHSMLGP